MVGGVTSESEAASSGTPLIEDRLGPKSSNATPLAHPVTSSNPSTPALGSEAGAVLEPTHGWEGRREGARRYEQGQANTLLRYP